MYARPKRSARAAALAAGLGFLLALSACSAEDSTASTGADTDAQVASSDADAVPSSAKAQPPSAAAGAASLTDGAKVLEVKPVDRKPVDAPPTEKIDPDAARKLADRSGHDHGKGALSNEEYKAEMMKLNEQLKSGQIDNKQFAIERKQLTDRQRGVISAPIEVDPDGAQLVFATKEKDFGTVWDTQDLTFEFAFQNQGKKTLEITKIKPSCGCTTTSLSRTSFEPGMGEMIPMTWKPKGIGPQKKTITVSWNNGPDQILNISANIKPFVEAERVLRLGDLPQHEAHHTELVLKPANDSYRITNIKASNQYLTATEKGRDAEGNVLIDVVIRDNAPWGNFNARLEIDGEGVTEPGGEPVAHKVMTQVIAKMYGDIRMEPEQIQLGVVAKDSKFRGESILYHVDGDEFELAELSMRFSRPEMTATWEPTTRDGKYAVKIIIEGDTTGFAENFVRGTAFFKTNLGDADNQQLQIAGSVR